MGTEVGFGRIGQTIPQLFPVCLKNNGRFEKPLGRALVKGRVTAAPQNCQLNHPIENPALIGRFGRTLCRKKNGLCTLKDSKKPKAGHLAGLVSRRLPLGLWVVVSSSPMWGVERT